MVSKQKFLKAILCGTGFATPSKTFQMFLSLRKIIFAHRNLLSAIVGWIEERNPTFSATQPAQLAKNNFRTPEAFAKNDFRTPEAFAKNDFRTPEAFAKNDFRTPEAFAKMIFALRRILRKMIFALRMRLLRKMIFALRRLFCEK